MPTYNVKNVSIYHLSIYGETETEKDMFFNFIFNADLLNV